MIAKKLHLSILTGLIACVITATALVVLLVITLHEQDKKLEGRLFPAVYIDGESVSRKTKDEVQAQLAKKNKNLSKALITVLYDKQPIATFSGETLDLHYNTKEVVDQAYLVGRSENQASRFYQRFAALFKLERYDFTQKLIYDEDVVKNFVEDAKTAYNKEPVNAKFLFENGRVTSFAPEEKGYKIEDTRFSSDFDALIQTFKKKPGNKSVTLSRITIQPEITLASANDFGIEELVGVGKSDFSHSIPGRIHNLTLAASRFNGVLIPPGETLSFNDVIGDISAATGYQPAYIIKNGQTVLGDGGGVCQASTTLFRAALNTGLPIVERTAHAYRVGYYENDSQPGYDATVYSPSVDLKIKNDMSTHILIQTQVDAANSLMYFNFYGKKDGRTIAISPATVSGVQPAPPPRNQDDPTLKKGVVKQVDFAASGARVFFSYKVTKDGKTLQDQIFASNYKPWQAVFLVGTAD